MRRQESKRCSTGEFVALTISVSLALSILTGPARALPLLIQAQNTKPVPASAPAEKKSAPTAEEASALELRGVELLREAGREGALLDDKRQSVRIQATAADALWTRDEAVARGFFTQSFQKAVDYYRESNDDNTDKRGGVTTRRDDLRLEVIKLAGKHDPELAKSFTDQYVTDLKRIAETRPQAPEQKKNFENNPALYGKTEPGGAELVMSARSLIETDHKMATDLAIRAMAGGIPTQMSGFLNELANKSRESADLVFQTALKRLSSEPQPAPAQLLVLAAYPFGENRVFISDGSSMSSMGFNMPRNFAINERQVDAFLTVGAMVLAKNSEINAAATPELAPRLNSGIFAARLLEPKVAQYKPAMLEDWRALTARLQSASTAKVREGMDETFKEMAAERDRDQGVVQTGSGSGSSDRLKAMLEAAERAQNFDEKDSRFMNAAQLALRDGDYARALEIADRINDMDFRAKCKAWISSRAASKAIQEKRIDDALKYVNDVSEPDERAYLIYQIANVAIGKEDKTRAIEVLEDAIRYVSKVDPGMGKLRALIGLAGLYLRLDVARSFEVLGDAVKVADKVGNYSPDDARLVRTLTDKRGNGSVSVTNADEFNLSRTFASFAAVDFDRTLTLATSFESKSLKYAAMIAVAGKLLERTPAKGT